MDLPTDIIQNNISKYLLEDKQINKIFNNKEDNELKFILFGNNIALPYMNIYSIENKMEVKNDELMKYVNYILKQKIQIRLLKKLMLLFMKSMQKVKVALHGLKR